MKNIYPGDLLNFSRPVPNVDLGSRITKPLLRSTLIQRSANRRVDLDEPCLVIATWYEGAPTVESDVMFIMTRTGPGYVFLTELTKSKVMVLAQAFDDKPIEKRLTK